MKRSLIALLLLSTVAYGQQRSLPPQKTLTQGPPGSVTLTLAEFNRLVELAGRKPKPSEAAPVPFILAHAAFKLRIENESLVGSLDIDGDVLQKGPTKVPLTTGLTILEAQQAQKPLPLLQEGSTHSAIVSGPGPFAVSMNIASALTVDAGRASFMLPVPSAGSSLLSLDLPGNHANVRVEPGLITNRATANGHTLIEAALEPGKPARVWWTTREIAAPVAQREVRFLSDIKTLLSVGDSELRIAALCDITVIQGESSDFSVPLPPGFEVTEVTGSTLESSEAQGGVLTLKVREPARRTHQFLIAIERPNQDKKLDAPFLVFTGAQRETGELLVEGVGAMELKTTEGGGLKRIDVREAGPITRSLARFPIQGAFRYQRRQGDAPKLMLEWDQFADSSVLSAIAERATVTTLLNAEGKTLTEVTLRVRNHSQPFVRIQLPPGSNLLSAEVEGEKVKPVLGTDGSRVPLLRTGFRPSGPYTVSFVYLSSGAAFSKSGAYELSIPKMDVPVSLMTWEVSLPERLNVKQVTGNAMSAALFPAGSQDVLAAVDDSEQGDMNIWAPTIDIGRMEAGQIGGIVVDRQGAVVPGAVITVVNTETGATQSAKSDPDGRWLVSDVRPGPVRVSVASPGFRGFQQELAFDSSRPARLGITIDGGAVSESVEVTTSRVDIAGSRIIDSRRIQDLQSNAQTGINAQIAVNSQNVSNLQRKVAGILPVKIEVPRAGMSYRFVRPLVLEEETRITFQYKSR